MYLSNKKLSQEERELLGTEQGALAAILGYLKAERGKMPPSVVNKQMVSLGYPKQKKQDLTRVIAEFSSNPALENLFFKAYSRVIKLDDIPSALGEDDSLKETNLFDQITPYVVDKEGMNANWRELRKLQREGVYTQHLFEGLKESIVKELSGMPRAKYLRTPIPKPSKGDKSLILAFSDWHIGSLVYNEDTGGYHFEKLKGQIQDVIDQVQQLIEDLDIKHLYIFHIGDIIEHISMRNVNQAFDAEFPASEQIAKGVRVIADLLSTLSQRIHVTFGIVSGNHDRFQGNKNDKIYNDTVTYIILDMLFLIQESFGGLPNVTLLDNRKDTYEFTVKVAGKNVKVKHGDHEKKKDDVKIPKHIKDEPIDLLYLGHIHSTRIVQEDFSRFHIYVGSTMGANSYSKELNLPTTSPSQMVTILTEGSDTPIFIPIMLTNKEDTQ